MAAHAPLAGLKVIDASTMYAAPLIATLLADHGAEVLKVEPPAGDAYRAYPALWSVVARGKGSITLDLRDEKDRARLRAIVPDIDVIVFNAPPALLEKWRLDYGTLSALNPGLVMAHFSGYGLSGPYATRAGNGTCSEAFCGLTHLTGEADGPPVLPSAPLGDGVAAFSGAFGVLAACYKRLKHGTGALIDINPVDALLQVTGSVLAGYSGAGTPPARLGSRMAGPNLRNVFKTRDGKWIAFALSTPRQWEQVAKLAGHGGAVNENELPALEESVRSWTASQLRDDALRQLLGLSLMVAPVNDAGDLLADPHVKARHSLLQVEDPAGNSALNPAPAPRFVGVEPVQVLRTPALGDSNGRPANWKSRVDCPPS